MCVKRGLKLTANAFESHSGLIHPNVERIRCWPTSDTDQITVKHWIMGFSQQFSNNSHILAAAKTHAKRSRMLVASFE